MSNGLLALGQLPPQPAPLELGGCQDPSFDPVEDGPHAAEGVVVSEVELHRRLVAFPDGQDAAVQLLLYFHFGGYCCVQGTFVGKSCRIIVWALAYFRDTFPCTLDPISAGIC